MSGGDKGRIVADDEESVVDDIVEEVKVRVREQRETENSGFFFTGRPRTRPVGRRQSSFKGFGRLSNALAPPKALDVSDADSKDSDDGMRFSGMRRLSRVELRLSRKADEDGSAEGSGVESFQDDDCAQFFSSRNSRKRRSSVSFSLRH